MKRSRKRTVVIYCGACESRCTLEVDWSSSPEEIYKEQHDTFYVCADCTPEVERLEREENLHYFSSHLIESVVNYSSHIIIPRSKYLRQEALVGGISNDNVEVSIEKAANLLKAANAIIILAGAGMSADSNIATFRADKVIDNSFTEQDQNSYDFLTRQISLEDACYRTKPEKAWFYDAGYREAILNCTPHAGYAKLLQILEHLNKPFFVMTTNIDRYFVRSGFPEENFYETHGSVEFLQCANAGEQRCEGVWKWPSESHSPVLDKKSISCDIDTVPSCIYCGGMARCNVSHFPDDPADIDGSVKRDQRHKLIKWLKNIHDKLFNVELKKRKNNKKVCGSPVGNNSTYNSIDGGLVVLEIGSGISNHGLRAESNLLLSSHPEVGFGKHSSLIRINPDAGLIPVADSNNVAEQHLTNMCFVRLGAMAAFELLHPCIMSEKL